MAELLRYDRLAVSYSGTPAVQGISFAVQPGEILGIVGESGSGKSTLLKTPMGLLGPEAAIQQGAVYYNGRNLAALPPKALRQLCGPELGFVFQNAGSSFSPLRTVGAQLYETMREHGRITRQAFTAQALELLARLGFADGQRVLDSYPFELSGGMQQRAGIAAAMLLHPKVLLADEPTAALDEKSRRQVVEELLLVRRTFGTAMVLVTHNIGLVRAMADTVLVLKDGCMVEYGPAQRVLTAPQAAYTRLLLAAEPKRKGERRCNRCCRWRT